MPPSPYTQPTTRQAKINDFTNADLPLANASFKRQDDETNVAMETFFFPFVHGNPNNLAACQTVATAQLSVRTCRGFVLWTFWSAPLHLRPI